MPQFITEIQVAGRLQNLQKGITQCLGIENHEIDVDHEEGVSKIAVTLNINKNVQTLIDIEEISFVGEEEVMLIDSDLIHKRYSTNMQRRGEICIGGVPKKTRGTNLIGRFLALEIRIHARQ